MNGLRTRNTIHRARTDRDRAELAERMDAIIARLCGVGLLVLLVLTIVQVIEQVAP